MDTCKNCGHPIKKRGKNLLHLSTTQKHYAEAYTIKCYECDCKKPERENETSKWCPRCEKMVDTTTHSCFGGQERKPRKKVLGFWKKDGEPMLDDDHLGRGYWISNHKLVPVVSLEEHKAKIKELEAVPLEWLEKKCKDRLKMLNTWKANFVTEKERLEFELMKKVAKWEINDLLSAAKKRRD